MFKVFGVSPGNSPFILSVTFIPSQFSAPLSVHRLFFSLPLSMRSAPSHPAHLRYTTTRSRKLGENPNQSAFVGEGGFFGEKIECKASRNLTRIERGVTGKWGHEGNVEISSTHSLACTGLVLYMVTFCDWLTYL